MKEQYVFDTMEIAIAAASHINSNDIFPYDRGYDALTTNYIKISQIKVRATDEKPYFERIHEEFRNQLTQEQIDYFNVNFPHTIEVFSRDWLPADEE